ALSRLNLLKTQVASWSSRVAVSMAIDPALRDEIWRQNLIREALLDRQRDEQWGFLANYDQRGQPKTAAKHGSEGGTERSLLDTSDRLAVTVPSTEAGNYGNKVGSQTGQLIANLQNRSEASNRRKKMDKDFVFS
ncbi:hypothetical protein BOX15_Mlig021624g1, partial [Macrostomum lignano]